MKIIISPAKSLDFETQAPISEFSENLFLDKSSEINKVLRLQSAKELSKLMKISDNLGQLNYERNQNWALPFSIENSKQAIYSFTGDVYKGLDASTIPTDKIKTLQDKLRILSGLYGMLKPLDLIQAYRLEMGTKLSVNKSKNLYDFWGDTLANQLNEEMFETDLLIDLASNEYSKVIPKKKLKAQLITPIFKELKGDTYKVVAFHAKKARGLMTRFIILNDIETVSDLKNFDTDGYRYTENLSTATELVFTR